MIDDESQIDRLAVRILTKHFNEFIQACSDENGKPKAPSQRDLMQARACIPKGHSMTLVKEKA